MKTTLPILSLFIFAFVTKAPLVVSTAVASPDPVLEIAGKKLCAGTDYDILPDFRGRGGGLTLASTGKETCPLDVVHDRHEVENGLPVTFSPVNMKKGVIRLSTDQNIKFSPSTICVQSTVWKLDSHDDSLGQWFVTTRGVEGNPGRRTMSNWFKLEKFDEDYKACFLPFNL